MKPYLRTNITHWSNCTIRSTRPRRSLHMRHIEETFVRLLFHNTNYIRLHPHQTKNQQTTAVHRVLVLQWVLVAPESPYHLHHPADSKE